MSASAEFHYRIPGRATGLHPGSHRGRSAGGGFEFRGHIGLLDQPDPRRLDLRASLRDPLGGLRFRAYNQQTSVPVTAIVDLSASMGFAGKLSVVADFISAAGVSTHRSGDPFAVIGAGGAGRQVDQFLLPPTKAKGAAAALAERLRRFTPTAGGAAVAAAIKRLGRQRGLVFLCSDFHWPEPLIETALAGLAGHSVAVVPLVFWHSAEYRRLPRFGLAEISDPETGARRTLLLRPALRQRIAARFAARRQRLQQLFIGAGAPPLFIHERFDANAITRYFYG